MGQFDLEEGVVEACFMEGLAGLAGRSKRRPARQTTKIKLAAAKPSSFAHEDRHWNQDNSAEQQSSSTDAPPGCWRGKSGGVICT